MSLPGKCSIKVLNSTLHFYHAYSYSSALERQVLSLFFNLYYLCNYWTDYPNKHEQSFFI